VDELYVDEFWYFMTELERINQDQKKQLDPDWLRNPKYQKKK